MPSPAPKPVPEAASWSESWTLGAATRAGAADSATVALGGPTIYGMQEVEVVSRLEAEQRISALQSHLLEQVKEGLLGDEAGEAFVSSRKLNTLGLKWKYDGPNATSADLLDYRRDLKAALGSLQLPTGEDCERCGGSREIPDERYCNCIMQAHCHGKGGKDGRRCRLRRFGGGDEGNPGVAGAPRVPCPDCQPPSGSDEGSGAGETCEECEAPVGKLHRLGCSVYEPDPQPPTEGSGAGR